MEIINASKNIFRSPSEETLEKLMRDSFLASEELKNLSGERKADFLVAIGEEILALGDNLVNAAMNESGLPEGRIVGERGRTVGQLNLFADLIREGSWVDATIDTAIPDRQPLPKADLRKMLRPLGVVAVFGASNFPLAFSTAGGDTASALAGGNSVVMKAHEGHPETSDWVALAIQKAAERTGMPENAFTLVHGSGATVGQAIVKHPICKAVGFTGSEYAGRILFDLAAQRKEPIPVFAEMGSINPVLILPEALEENAEDWAKTYAGSITLGVGQFCTNPGLLLIKDGEKANLFAYNLAKAISDIAPAKMLNGKVKNGYDASLANALEQKGITVIGESSTKANNANIEGAPTVASVDARTFIANPELHKEVFGPYSLLVRYTGEDELLEAIEALSGQLTATVIGSEPSLEKYSQAIDALLARTGRIIFNGVPTGVEVCPSMHHGGPYPASTDSRFTSVGTDAIKRFARPVSYQSWPQSLLPDELKDENPLNIWRLVNNSLSTEKIN
ncbi:2,5-dioxovalerate dehydrogenase [Fulvitalea axinellae]|uniref:2,5-dioxovalerate dehydrogenase n=1 Tax=Fulvitalea axinellae TaxID=1182444 RepID=A0AAU9DHV6_9BACT|nr:2,5-dioxovalerate dehydrogenase [Fulvitalea axinellae]